MASTLTDFALTGRLGVLSLGITKDEVRGLLGEPWDVSATRPTIWKYGAVEVAFTDDRAAQIHAYVSQAERDLPDQLGAIADLTADSSLSDVLVAMSERGAALETVPVLSYDDQLTFSVRDSSVHLVFVRERLHSVGIAT
ncbi:MAG: hypothetical protein WD027_07650 [Gaiellales bacterium]